MNRKILDDSWANPRGPMVFPKFFFMGKAKPPFYDFALTPIR